MSIDLYSTSYREAYILDSTKFDAKFSEITSNRLGYIEELLEEYLIFKHGITSTRLKEIMSNVNNFKLKNFHKVVTPEADYFYDKDVLILTVYNWYNAGSYRSPLSQISLNVDVIKHWETPVRPVDIKFTIT